MAQIETLVTTWTRLFSEHYPNPASFDPEGLMPEEYGQACVEKQENAANAYLEPYGMTLLGNGEIVGPHHTSPDAGSFETWDEEAQEGFVEVINSLEYDDLFAQYA